MISETKLKFNEKYEYNSPSYGKRITVIFKQKRNKTFVFLNPDSLNEIWVTSLENIFLK